jgi:tetratricopeptide (TPR) repeat protein
MEGRRHVETRKLRIALTARTGCYLDVLRGNAKIAAGMRAFTPGVCLFSFIGLGLGGCETVGDGPPLAFLESFLRAPATTATVEEPEDVKYYLSDEPLHLGTEHFNRGHYGLAERYFRDAVEKAPRDVAAWIGLAASYDRLARFDLADRAYANALRLAGQTTQILNNQGYSYMLRGDFKQAREKFILAYQREPNNPAIINNLQLLDSSRKFAQRLPEQP